MAHPKETREKLRRLYVSDGQTLEIAATMCEIPTATARNWKRAAKEQGAEWGRVRAASAWGGGGIEDLSRSLLAGFLVQYQSTMTMLQDTSVEELPPSERAKLLASLSDAFTKTVAANKRVLPEIQESAVAIKVIEKLFAYIADRHPDMLAAFDEVLQGFQAVIEKEF